MDIIRLAIRQPVSVVVGIVFILIAGVIALGRLPISLTPTIEEPVITVTTFWEGASPSDVEQSVIDPQEERLTSLTGLTLMTSTSRQSSGKIRLQFALDVDKNDALREIAQRLNEVSSYPADVDEPVIEATDSENRDYIAWVVFGTDDSELDVRTLRDFVVDRIEPALERVPGIAEINVLGGREREVQIQIDLRRLAQYGITPSEFAGAIRDTNQNISAGQRADGKLDVRLRTIGQYASLDEIARTVLRDNERGTVVVGDVATVHDTFKEPTSFVRSAGRPVIAINAERELDSNVIEVMAGLRAELDRLNGPDGVLAMEARRRGLDGPLWLHQVYDQTIYVEQAVDLVRSNIWIGGGLAVFVLLLFLRSVRTIGIIALAIPISVIGAIVAMVALGRSMNVISLAGLAFSVGMVVDNAIVVLENIFRHIEMGKHPRRAAEDGAREVWGAVLASTLTTIIVFIPILLIQGQAGQLFRDLAIAICAAVGLSLIVSMTVIPCAAARLLRPRRVDAGPRSKRTLTDRFAGFIGWATRRPVASLVVVATLTIISVVGTIFLRPPADYLPTGNRNLVFGLIIPPPGYNIAQMTSLAERIEETISPFYEAGQLRETDPDGYDAATAALPEVPTFDWMKQAPGDPVVPPSLENYFLVSFDGILFHGGISDDPDRVVDVLPLFSHATRAEQVPGVIAFPFQVPLFSLGGSTGSAIKLQMTGPDLAELTRCGESLFLSLMGREEFQQVQPSPGNFTIPAPEVQVRPDLVRLSEIGLTTTDVGLIVRAMGDGAILDDYRIAGDSVDLKVISVDAVDKVSMTNLKDVPIATASGRVVDLGSIAEVRRIGAPEEIARVGRRRAISFEVTPQQGLALEEAIGTLQGIVDEARERGAIPASVETTMAGSASKLEEVRTALVGDGTLAGTLGSSFVLALLVVYLLMCVLFQSFLQPFVIMFSVPLATLGGFAALFVVFIWSAMDRYMPMQMLDVLTMIGFVLLIGIVVNNAILIVHQTLNFLSGRSNGGDVMAPSDAIAAAVRTRVRPIFMSTFTSVGGMLPLVLMPGAGSELYRGLGSVVVGGLLISSIFTLLLVPLLLGLVFRIKVPTFEREETVRPATA